MWKTTRSRHAGMAELADARDLKSREIFSRTGSTPASGTNNIAEWSSLVARRAHNPKVMRFKSHLRNQRNSEHCLVCRVFSFALRKRCEMEFEPHALRSTSTLRVALSILYLHCLNKSFKTHLKRQQRSGIHSALAAEYCVTRRYEPTHKAKAEQSPPTLPRVANNPSLLFSSPQPNKKQ